MSPTQDTSSDGSKPDGLLPSPLGKRFAVFIALFILACALGAIMIWSAELNVSRWVVYPLFVLYLIVATVLLVKVGAKSAFHRFIVLYGVLGLACLIIIPPFSTPDSPQQYLRAFDISQGHLVTSIDEVVVEPGDEEHQMGATYLPSGLLPDLDIVQISIEDVASTWDRTIDRQEPMLYSTSTQATYSPLCFLPASLGIFLTSLIPGLGQSMWALAYAARLFTFLFCGIVLALCVRRLPFAKEPCILFALLPPFIELYASWSADAVTLVCIMAFITYVLHLRQEGSRASLPLLILLSVVVALMKIVYVPIVLLVFLVPEARFGDRRRKMIQCCIVVAVALLANLLWLAIASGYLLEYNSGVSSTDQLINIVTHPLSYIAVILRTVLAEGDTAYFQVFGAELNWMNARPPLILPLVLSLLCLKALFFDRKGSTLGIPKKQRILIGVVVACIALLILTSLYVQWTPVGAETIAGVQGRYFIPLFLPLFLLGARDLRLERPQVFWVSWFYLVTLIYLPTLEIAL